MKEQKRQPTHPGEIVRQDYLEPLSLTISELASTLGVSRNAVSNIVNERSSVTPQMALRLARAFDTTPDFWLNLQKNYDLWEAQHASDEWQDAKPIPPERLHSPS